MVEQLVYLFVGDDNIAKKKKIDDIKERFLDKDLKEIDFSVVYADDKDLTPQRFDEVLSYLPASKSKKRIVVIKKTESLKRENKEVLLKRIKKPCNSVMLLLDADSSEATYALIKELGPFVKKIEVAAKEKIDVFQLTEAIISHKTTDALSILNKLLQNREKSPAILGALFWQWDKAKDKLGPEQFKQGLKLLLDTDSRIKTGRLDEKLALELAVMRLSYLV